MRSHLSSSSVATDLAMGVPPTRIWPRSRSYDASTLRRLSLRSPRALAWKNMIEVDEISRL